MKIFIIPSWQPSPSHPTTGIFFYDQVKILAKKRLDWKMAISAWGSHEPALWLTPLNPLDFFLKRYSNLPVRKKEEVIESNLVHFVNPCHTWTRRFLSGNLLQIVKANEENLQKFVDYFGKPDVIHAQVSFPAGWIAKQLSEKFHIPFIITEHMSPFPLPGIKDVFKKYVILALQAANGLIAVSEHLQKKLREYQLTTKFIPNFIDESFFDVSKSFPSTRKTLIAVGRLEKQKNYPLLIGAVKKLIDSGVDVQLKIAGEGSERKKLTRLIIRMGLAERVEMLGDIDKISLKMLLDSANRLVTSSLHENLPVAIMEALACGIPIISTPWNGAHNMMKGEVAIISEDFEIDNFSKSISTSLSQEYDKNQIRQYYLNHFGNENVIRQLEKAYRSVLKN